MEQQRNAKKREAWERVKAGSPESAKRIQMLTATFGKPDGLLIRKGDEVLIEHGDIHCGTQRRQISREGFIDPFIYEPRTEKIYAPESTKWMKKNSDSMKYD